MNFKDDEMRQIGTAYMITQSNQFVGNFLQIIYLVSVYFIWLSFGSPVYTFLAHSREFGRSTKEHWLILLLVIVV